MRGTSVVRVAGKVSCRADLVTVGETAHVEEVRKAGISEFKARIEVARVVGLLIVVC